MGRVCTEHGPYACAELSLEMWEALLVVPRALVCETMGGTLWTRIVRAVLVRAIRSQDADEVCCSDGGRV